MIHSEIKSAAQSALDRRSIRSYSEVQVSDETLSELLTLAGRAPSAWNIQPWRVHAVRNQDLKNKIQEAAFGQPQVGAASVLLVITSDMKAADSQYEAAFAYMGEEKATGQAAYVRDYFSKMPSEAVEGWGRNQSNIFLGYLLLLAETMGLATSPMLGFNPDAVKTILGLPANVEVSALVAVGYAGDNGFESARLPIETIVKHHK